jgi:excisionase family DNA binding protein
MTEHQLTDFVTSKEAARVLRVTQRRIRQLCAAGYLECALIAGRWLVKRSSLERYTKPPKGRPRRNP